MPTELTLSSQVVVSPDALDREVGDRVLILHHVTGQYFALDPVGTRMWQLLRENDGRVQAVFDRMLEEYDVPGQQLASDLLGVLEDLRAKGLLSA